MGQNWDRFYILYIRSKCFLCLHRFGIVHVNSCQHSLFQKIYFRPETCSTNMLSRNAMVTGFMINHSKIPDSFYNHFTFELSLKLCFMNNHGKYAQDMLKCKIQCKSRQIHNIIMRTLLQYNVQFFVLYSCLL